MKISPNKACQSGSLKILRLKQNQIDASLDQIKDNYLNGNIVVIENFKPPFDLSLFNFPTIKRIEDIAQDNGKADKQYLYKLKMMYKKPNPSVIAPLIYKNPKESKLFLALMHNCSQYVSKIFSNFLELENNKGLKDVSTWRFSYTTKGDYHLDNYSELVLRAFWNLSANPREWGIGHKIDDLLTIYEIEINNFILDSFNFGEKLDQVKINNFLLPYLQKLNNHIITFDQYDLWLCDSTKVAHQILSGEKLAAFSFSPQGDSKMKRSIFEKLNYITYLMNKN